MIDQSFLLCCMDDQPHLGQDHILDEMFDQDYFEDAEEEELQWVDMPPDLEPVSDSEDESPDLEDEWEPHVSSPSHLEPSFHPIDSETPASHSTTFRSTRRASEDPLWNTPTIIPFPLASAGRKIRVGGEYPYLQMWKKVKGHQNNLYNPFISRLDWEVARWAKLRGPSASAFDEFLKIPGVSSSYVSLIFDVTEIQYRLLIALACPSKTSKSSMISLTMVFPKVHVHSFNVSKSSLEMKRWMSTFVMSWNVSAHSMGTLSLLPILSSSQSSILWMRIRLSVFFMTCTQAIGGGVLRYSSSIISGNYD
jgi:hypothetical protein